MTRAAPKPCAHAGCPTLVFDGGGWCEKHRRASWSQKRDTPVKRVTGRRLQRMRAELFRDKPLCAKCLEQGLITPATERDHIVPLFEGGTDDRDNIQALCADCHAAKTAAEALRARRGGAKV